jgi:hypothetical protein
MAPNKSGNFSLRQLLLISLRLVVIFLILSNHCICIMPSYYIYYYALSLRFSLLPLITFPIMPIYYIYHYLYTFSTFLLVPTYYTHYVNVLNVSLYPHYFPIGLAYFSEYTVL